MENFGIKKYVSHPKFFEFLDKLLTVTAKIEGILRQRDKIHIEVQRTLLSRHYPPKAPKM